MYEQEFAIKIITSENRFVNSKFAEKTRKIIPMIEYYLAKNDKRIFFR